MLEVCTCIGPSAGKSPPDDVAKILSIRPFLCYLYIQSTKILTIRCILRAQISPKSVFGRCSAQTPLGDLMTLPRPLVGWGAGRGIPLSTLDAFSVSTPLGGTYDTLQTPSWLAMGIPFSPSTTMVSRFWHPLRPRAFSVSLPSGAPELWMGRWLIQPCKSTSRTSVFLMHWVR